jgi:hypothetical protein
VRDYFEKQWPLKRKFGEKKKTSKKKLQDQALIQTKVKAED